MPIPASTKCKKTQALWQPRCYDHIADHFPHFLGYPKDPGSLNLPSISRWKEEEKAAGEMRQGAALNLVYNGVSSGWALLKLSLHGLSISTGIKADSDYCTELTDMPHTQTHLKHRGTKRMKVLLLMMPTAKTQAATIAHFQQVEEEAVKWRETIHQHLNSYFT